MESEYSEPPSSPIQELQNLSLNNDIDNTLVQTIINEMNNANNKDPNISHPIPVLHSNIGNPANNKPENYIQPNTINEQNILNNQIPPHLNPNLVKQMNPHMQQQIPPHLNPQMEQQIPPHLQNQLNMNPDLNNYMYNQNMIDIMNNENSIYTKLSKHLKETIFVVILFMLLSCESLRTACAKNIPKLNTEDGNLNMWGTTLLSVIYGLIYIGGRQFI
jgi:hypothetical protein